MPASAEIIRFPARRAPAEPVAAVPSADAGTERLARGLAALARALDEQRAAVRDWRMGLAALGRSVAGLDASLHVYRNSLAGVQRRTASLHAEARRLEAWADAALASGIGPLSRRPAR
ncbi:MAG: hypothetical protein KGL52_18995 [Rhodospirillales bacterium]|nr:hypothetical protein [Rhodospirillales bacterium]